MGTVLVLNAIALYVFPAWHHVLHLTPVQFSTWAGAAIHDVSSVVGAASQLELDALERVFISISSLGLISQFVH